MVIRQRYVVGGRQVNAVVAYKHEQGIVVPRFLSAAVYKIADGPVGVFIGDFDGVGTARFELCKRRQGEGRMLISLIVRHAYFLKYSSS